MIFVNFAVEKKESFLEDITGKKNKFLSVNSKNKSK